MFSLIKKLLTFRVAQTSAKGAARMLGFGRLSFIVGLIGGVRSLRHHRHA